MTENLYAEIIHIRPKSPEARERLLAIRDDLVASYRKHYPQYVTSLLLAPEESDSWIDHWSWTSKEGAEAALASNALTPLFDEWGTLVDVLSFEWAVVLDEEHR